MAKAKMDLSFNFGANVKPKKRRTGRKGKRKAGGNAWAAYVGESKRRR
jgi:hypothetical protein